MEAEGIPTNATKRPRIANGGGKEEDGDHGVRRRGGCGGAAAAAAAASAAAVAAWAHPSSRIFRVSRATGGKDRHSKVYTAKGLRDRRVRLSVPTAIQFYDLQDRLGFDQPSKAIEWLIKAASAAIDDLPSLDGSSFPPPPSRLPLPLPAPESDEPPPPPPQFSKSGCSSTSETSKGSVLSLSRSESRVKARERARKRTTAKDKEEEDEDDDPDHQHNETSFTELLTSGSNNNGGAPPNFSWHLPAPAAAATKPDFFAQEAGVKTHQIQIQSPHYVNSQPTPPFAVAAAAAVSDHQEMQQFSFLQDQAAAAGESLGFSITSGLTGFARGTLQSNSAPSHQLPHHHQNLQRFSSPVDASSLSFFFGAPAQAGSAEAPFSAGFDSRPHLWDGFRHSDLKGKGKN